MATEFRRGDGSLVALRWWGGDTMGTRVELFPSAGAVDMHTPLLGSDGTRETLRTLASSLESEEQRARRAVLNQQRRGE